MSNTIKLALYTDFSEESSVTLESLIFNTWGFDFDLDILCILNDDNIREVLEKLEDLKEELSYKLEKGHIVRTKVFLRGEEDLFINHINRESYFCLLVGIADSKTSWQPHSTYHNILTKTKVDLSLVPLSHEVKIENRGIISLELRNIEKIYKLKRFVDYLEFYCAKIRFMLITDDLISKSEMDEVSELVERVLPGLYFDFTNVRKSHCDEVIIQEVLESPIDYLFYFNDDYLEDLIKNKLQAALFPGIHEFSLVKVYVDQEMLEDIKFGPGEQIKIQLKEKAEKKNL